MLASLLPGLRDVRVPLATGFLWLVVLWLLFYPVIPSQDDAVGLSAEVYRALGAFGPAALIAMVTFIAYLVGIVLVRPGTRLVQGILRAVGLAGLPLSTSSVVEAEQLARRTTAALDEAGVRLPSTPGGDSREEPSRVLTQRMADEVPLVATRLLAENRELFDRYDRADAEAAFRLAVALPLVVISALTAWRLELDWWGCIIAVGTGASVAAVLLIEGARKRMESNDAIYQAVFAGKAAFPSIETAEAALAEERTGRENAQEILERQKAAERDATEAARAAETKAQRAAHAEASLITIELRGGAGHGSPGAQQLTSVHVDIANDSASRAMVERFQLEPPLVAKRYPQFPMRLGPGETTTELIEVQEIDIRPGELSGAPLQRFKANLTYRLGTTSWERSSEADTGPIALT